MTHKHDFVERVRRYFIPKLGRVTAAINRETGTDYYVERPTDHREFVGTVPLDEEALEARLHDINAVRNPLAAWKHLPGVGVDEQGSWAWRGDVLVDENGNYVFEHDPWADMQLHFILYEIDGSLGSTAVFAHWEYSWKTHPIKHYNGGGLNGEWRDHTGVEYALEIFDQNDVPLIDDN